MKHFVRFPWGTFWKYFLFQVVSFNLLFVLVIFILDRRYVAQEFAYNEALLNFFVFSLFVAAFSSYRFTRPLQRLIIKALRISSKKAYGSLIDPQDADLLDDELGVFVELDLALNHINRKMKKRKALLLQSREEAQAFTSSVAEGLVTISLDQKILYFNSQFGAQFLASEQLESVVLRLSEAIRSPDVIEGFEKTLREGKVNRFTVKLQTLLEKAPRYFAISVNPIRNAKTQEIYGVVGIFHDITDLKRLEQVRIDFVANASHELRTPLSSMKGYIETLKEDLQTGNLSQAEHFVGVVSNNIDRMIDLVGDLLNLSKLESQSDIKKTLIHPLEITENIVGEMAVLARDKDIAIRVVGNADPFMADSGKLEQVLRNLVSNAMKFIPRGGTVQVRWEQMPSGEVDLRVIDDGPGIAPEHLNRLFERFYRVDKGRSRDAGGTGLGLAIVKHIMQSHGGSVTVQNGAEKGCEFVCRFPVK